MLAGIEPGGTADPAYGSTSTDAATALVLLLAAVVSAGRTTDPFPYGILLATVAVAGRRRWPTAVCAVVGLGLLATFPLPVPDGVAADRRGVPGPCLLASAVYAATHALGPALLVVVVTAAADSSRLPYLTLAIPSPCCAAPGWRLPWCVPGPHRARVAGGGGPGRSERDTAYAAAVRDERARIAPGTPRHGHPPGQRHRDHSRGDTMLTRRSRSAIEPLCPLRPRRDALGTSEALLNLLATVSATTLTFIHSPAWPCCPASSPASPPRPPVACHVTGAHRQLPPGLDLAPPLPASSRDAHQLATALQPRRHPSQRRTRHRTSSPSTSRTTSRPRHPTTNVRCAGAGRSASGNASPPTAAPITIDDDPARPFAVLVHLCPAPVLAPMPGRALILGWPVPVDDDPLVRTGSASP